MDIVIRILRNLLKKWAYFLGLSIISAVAIFYLTKNESKLYMSEGKVLINLQNNKGISLSDEKMKPLEVITFFNNLIELSKSMKIVEQLKLQAVRDRVLNKHSFLPEIPHSDWGFDKADFLREMNLKIEGNNGQITEETISNMDYFLFEAGFTTGTIQKALKIYRIGGSYFMKVEVTTHDPHLSEYLANHFITLLRSEHKNSSKKSIQNHRAIIEELVKKSKAELDKKIDELETYKVKNNIINLGEHTKAIVNYIVELEKRKTHVLSSIAVHKSSKNQVLEKLSGDHELMPNTDSHQEIIALKNTLENLQQEHLNSQTSSNPRQLEAAMLEHKNSIKNNLLEFSNEIVYDPSQVQLNLAFRYLDHDIGVSSYQDELEVLHGEMDRVDQYSSKFAPYESTIVTLDKEIETARKTYLLMLNKLNLTESLHYGSGENIIEMIDQPKLPVKPLPSKRLILVIAGGTGTFILLTAGLVFGLLLDRTIQTATQFERESNLPLVAAYPKKLQEGADEKFQFAIGNIIKNQHAKVCHKIIDSGNKTVLITTNHSTDEITEMAVELQNSFSAFGQKALIINSLVSQNAKADQELDITNDQLEIDSAKIYSKQLEIASIMDNDHQYDFILVLVSPINTSSDIHYWRQYSRQVVHMHPAGKVYDQVDKRTEKLLQSDFNILAAGLFNLNHENIEDFLGEVPKRRSWIKRKVKSLLKGQLL